ncbi:MAG: dockerin type I domain-containing protein [bacterium]
MKKIVYIFAVLIILLMPSIVNAAEDYYVKISYYNGDINIRKSASSSSTKLAVAEQGTIATLLSTNISSGYYYIQLEDGTKGYVTASLTMPFIDLTSDISTTTKTCMTNLSKEGFPDSYLPYLCFLQSKYPDWVFNAVQTGLDWTTAVSKESSCGKSCISTNNSTYVDKSCTNVCDSGTSAASNTAVAYFLDPRNFLSENLIFMFENLLYDSSLKNQYESLVDNIIEDAAFYKYHKNIGNNLSAIINDAGYSKNVNPTFLASRIYQELGSTTTRYGLYSGVTTNFVGYYNFVNWGVSDSCATANGADYCGLTSAKSYNWYGLQPSIEGAAHVISENYISVGQYTTYLQKFNVVPTDPSKLYIHQYMTNVGAPYSESKTTYNSYETAGSLKQSFSFMIPIYKDMDELIENEFSGASGELGNSDTSDLSISTIVTSSGYSYTSKYISGFKEGLLVTKALSQITAIAGEGNVVIMDSDSKVVTTGVMKTGYQVKITNSTDSKTLSVIIYGDTSGDGVVNALDLLQVQKNILGTYTLSGVYKEAGDTSKDGEINALDLLQIQKDILELYTIEQK